jgi:glycosyltransferase involved in cell wall biosynthesis
MAFSVSVIIPAYNEEAIIQNAVKTAHDILSISGADYEIIVVNDGSKDRTKELLDNSFNQIEGIRIIHKPINEGFGSAIRTGIKLATKEYILCVPADSPMTHDLYRDFSQYAERADILVSYRRAKLGYSFQKHMNSYIYHRLVSVLFGMNLRDYNWIHMYHRRIFDEGRIEIEYNGIFMLAEILIKAKRKGYRFYEFEVEQKERLTGIATASKFSAIMRTLGEIINFRLRRRDQR